MREVALRRIHQGDQGTLSLVAIDGDHFSFAMEPPWRDNAVGLSCIPVGRYRCTWHQSPRYGGVYLVNDVPGRSYILFHAGNLGGDVVAGFKTHTQGCILLGKHVGHLGGQLAVLVSRPIVNAFFQRLAQAPFDLVVSHA